MDFACDSKRISNPLVLRVLNTEGGAGLGMDRDHSGGS